MKKVGKEGRRMKKVEEEKNFSTSPHDDIFDPFSYDYNQHLTNFDVFKVQYVRTFVRLEKQQKCLFV